MMGFLGCSLIASQEASILTRETKWKHARMLEAKARKWHITIPLHSTGQTLLKAGTDSRGGCFFGESCHKVTRQRLWIKRGVKNWVIHAINLHSLLLRVRVRAMLRCWTLWGTGGGKMVLELRKGICSSPWASQWHTVITWYWNGLPIDSYPFWYWMKGRFFPNNVCIFTGNSPKWQSFAILFGFHMLSLQYHGSQSRNLKVAWALWPFEWGWLRQACGKPTGAPKIACVREGVCVPGRMAMAWHRARKEHHTGAMGARVTWLLEYLLESELQLWILAPILSSWRDLGQVA